MKIQVLSAALLLSITACDEETPVTPTDNAPISDRITRLESRIAALESQSTKVAALEAQLSETQATLQATRMDVNNFGMALEDWALKVDGRVSATEIAIRDQTARVDSIETADLPVLRTDLATVSGRVDGISNSELPAIRTDVSSAVSFANANAPVLRAFSAATVDNQPAIVISGVNLVLRNGTGATTANGLGNLVIGYSTPDAASPGLRGGSHNLVIGEEHSYSGRYGIVFGTHNRGLADYVLASGRNNTVNGERGVTLAGSDNIVGAAAVAVTGNLNTLGAEAVTIAGYYNLAAGLSSSVIVNGRHHEAQGWGSTISGGTSNYIDANSIFATLVGGYYNGISGNGGWSTIFGGTCGMNSVKNSVVVGTVKATCGPSQY